MLVLTLARTGTHSDIFKPLYLLPAARWGVFLYLTTLKTYTTIK